ncbi:hypothetical protein EI427_09240 [Flammeovirga pectinis]|uniref:Chemotaxis methyl-accepting receptor HlyB-like 4HB MCP domain-containing protein n=1 Tax=Flammeovirga pectinis TaxID=2494373 RepID=A0A3Q9FQH1_9BACT|nr:hypothetical protein [Flammeovirga pectinis]AZQ62414.1 hypothetical protein EI427_09240 [Flammeovirga pectinis]
MKKQSVAHTWKKIIRWFYVYFVVCFVIAVGNFSSYRQVENQDLLLDKILEIRHMTLKMTLAAQEFLSYEAHYEDFHKSRTATPIMAEYHNIDKELTAYVDKMMSTNATWKIDNEQDLQQFRVFLNEHRTVFSQIITKLKFRGSPHSGMIGDLQKRTEALGREPYVSVVSLEKMKLLEKSYLLSADTSDFYKIRKINHQMQKEVNAISMPDVHKHQILNNLRRYNSTLLRVVEVDVRIGFRGDIGLTLTLQKRTEDIISLADKMYRDAKLKKDMWMSYSRWIAVVFGTLSVGVLLVLSLATNDVISKMK